MVQTKIQNMQEILKRIEAILEDFPENTLTQSLKNLKQLALQDLNLSIYCLRRETIYEWLGTRTVAYIKVDDQIFKISFGDIQLDQSDDIKDLDDSPPDWLKDYARQFI
jgi:hypothetical protein